MARAADLSAASASFVLTLEMDGEAFAAFDALRRRFYAPERNLVPAHVTLFYRLPGERSREVKALLRAVAFREKPLDITVGEARALERGVAFFLDAPRLNALRDQLSDEWWPWLEDDDKVRFQPHVTIQANVSEAEARRTIAGVRGLAPRRMRGVGLRLWRYRDGPWEHAELFRFR